MGATRVNICELDAFGPLARGRMWKEREGSGKLNNYREDNNDDDCMQ